MVYLPRNRGKEKKRMFEAIEIKIFYGQVENQSKIG